MAFPALLSVFLIALMGGMHCAAMCGGIAMAVEARASGQVNGQNNTAVLQYAPSRFHLLLGQFWMHLGRIFTYALLGFALGSLGATFWRQSWLPVQRSLFGIASALLLIYGLILLQQALQKSSGAWRWHRLEGWVAKLLRHAQQWFAPMTAKIFPPNRWWKRFLIGMGWGLVPCGMVYGALAIALLAGGAVSGAVVMLAFGLGTLPNLLLMSSFASFFRRWANHRNVRLASGSLIVVFGLWGLYRAFVLPQTLNGQGFCVVF